MKMPKDILFRRHAAMETRLDYLRRQVVAAECRNQAKTPSAEGAKLAAWPARIALKVWAELILPARRIWAGLATVWLLIIGVNILGADHSPLAEAKAKTQSPATLMALREQQKILAELFGSAEPLDAEKPKRNLPQPRSERQELWKLV